MEKATNKRVSYSMGFKDKSDNLSIGILVSQNIANITIFLRDT